MNRLYFGLLTSLVLHAGLIGWALVSFARTEPFKTPELEPVEVAIISEDDLVRLKKGSRSSKKLKTQAVKEPEPTRAKKPARQPTKRAAPPPPSSAEPEPKPAQDPIAEKLASLAEQKPALPDPNAIALQKAAEEKAKEEAARKAAEEQAAKAKAAEEAKRKAEEERKRREAEKQKERERKRKLAERKKREQERKKQEAKKKQQQFDQRMAALLNKVPDEAAPESGSVRDADRELPKGPEAGAPEGTDDRLTASEVAMIGVMMKSAVKRCWNINSGLEGAENLAVVVQIRLKPDGSVEGTPRIMNRRSDPYFNDAANSALRAILQCAPYDLPEHLYQGGWDFMELEFDPRQMF